MKHKQQIIHIDIAPLPKEFERCAQARDDLMNNVREYLCLIGSVQFSEDMKGVTFGDYVAFKEVQQYLKTHGTA